MSNLNSIRASALIDNWCDDLASGERPKRFPVGTGELGRIEVGPGLITLIGGAPGAGKTAFVMQAVFDALRLNPSLNGFVCNVEMPPIMLLDRQLARLSGIDLNTVRDRNFDTEHLERIEAGTGTIRSICDRLWFVRSPFTLTNVAQTIDSAKDECGDDVLLLFDYIQRISPPGSHRDNRSSVDATMNHLRRFADEGAAVIAVSAVGRQKDSRGRSSYDGDALGLASFRESSELEYGCDDAYILSREPSSHGRILRHLKARNTEARDISLNFDGARQSFDPIDTVLDSRQTRRVTQIQSIQAAWDAVPGDYDPDSIVGSA